MSAGAALLRACALLLCLVAGSRQLSITEFVVPDAVEVGENAELRCQYELGPEETETALFVKWWWKSAVLDSNDRKPIYQRIAGHAAEPAHHSNIEIKENDTIVLLELTPSNSGIYECEVSNIDEIRKHAELIVFTKGTGPELNISTIVDESDSSEDLLIECEADNVAPLPQLIVTLSDGNEINTTEIVSGPNSDGLYTIFANATRPKGEVTEGDIRCELLYVNPNISHAQYIDTESYNPAGDEVATTEVPDDTTEAEATPDSLQNARDDSYRLQSSWALPVIAAIMANLHTIF